MNERVRKVCEGCGRSFEVAREFEWQTQCYRCFRGEADAKVLVRELQAENKLLRHELSQLRISGPSRIAPRRWRQLLQLVHPDRHGNSEAANDCTRWLLEIRAEVEQS
jgi:hypothetical protein